MGSGPGEYHRQSAGDYDRAIASYLRWHFGSLSGFKDLCGAWRGISAVLCEPSDAVCRTFPYRVGPLPKKNPTAYLKDGQLFFDTIVFTPEALRHLIAETGPGQIMIGTDYPFPWTSTEVDLVLNTPNLSDDERSRSLAERSRGCSVSISEDAILAE